MNFFSHGIAFLDDPCFLAGTSVPDWLSVSDRPVRIRQRFINRFLTEDASESQSLPPASSQQLSFTLGARQHLQDDDWFHQQRSFVEVSTEMAIAFRTALGPDDNFRAGFLGHIVTEMLLDRMLISRYPERLEAYYQQLATINPDFLCDWVSAIATRRPERLPELFPRFLRERFLFDYLEFDKLRFRLNQVMRRVKLPELSEQIDEVLGTGADLVEQRAFELLPAYVLESLPS